MEKDISNLIDTFDKLKFNYKTLHIDKEKINNE